MKIYLVTAEHFSNPGLIQKAFATHDAAVAEAIELTKIMVEDMDWQPGDVNSATFNDFIERLQDYHGAAHCYAEVAEIEVAGSEGQALKAYEPADPAEIKAARNAYQDDDLEIDDDAAVSRAVAGYWVSAWVWIAGDDDRED